MRPPTRLSGTSNRRRCPSRSYKAFAAAVARAVAAVAATAPLNSKTVRRDGLDRDDAVLRAGCPTPASSAQLPTTTDTAAATDAAENAVDAAVAPTDAAAWLTRRRTVAIDVGFMGSEGDIVGSKLRRTHSTGSVQSETATPRCQRKQHASVSIVHVVPHSDLASA